MNFVSTKVSNDEYWHKRYLLNTNVAEMSDKINSNYLETYSQIFSERISSDYFGTKKFMSGQEIIQLTPSDQLNLMVIKTLFAAWQDELRKLKSNPYFDYRDYAVEEALKEFMNVLSRAIKIERTAFEPLLKKAVQDTVVLAVDPITFYSGEIDRADPESIAGYLKENKRYLKWHGRLLNVLIEKAEQDVSEGQLKRALSANYDYLKDELDQPVDLLVRLNQIEEIRYEELLVSPTETGETEPDIVDEPDEPIVTAASQKIDAGVDPIHSPEQSSELTKAIDPALAWAKFEMEEYSYMKGSLGSLAESVGINQKIMFTKVLFGGNHDLMMHAFKAVDESDSFVEAIELLNQRYVEELDWEIDSEEVGEFLQLVFRKFDQ